MLSSSKTGQGALQGLPCKSQTSNKRSISSYMLPENAVQDTKVAATPKRLKEGVAVFKVNKGGKLQNRRLAFSPDRRSLLVTTNRIKSVRSLLQAARGGSKAQSALSTTKSISIANMDRVQRGPNTGRFQKALSGDTNTSDLQDLLQTEGAFSIIYESISGSGHYESLDLAVPDPVDYENIVSTLEALVALRDEERRCWTREIQFLEYKWLCLSKPHASPLQMNEWMHLTENLEIQLPKMRLHDMFKEECRGKPLEELSLPETALLLSKVHRVSGAAALDPVESLWNSIIETDPVPVIGLDDSASYDSYELNVMQDAEESISTVAFLSFLRSQQKEYGRTLEDVTELVYALNQQQTAEDVVGETKNRTDKKKEDAAAIAPADRLTKSRFISFLQSDVNDIMETANIGKADMTRPLSHYWIATSHDTFLSPTLDNFNERAMSIPLQVDEQRYYAALLRGIRCLEITVWNGTGESKVPMIDRKRGSGHPFSVCLKSIRHYLKQDPYSFPIILKIENHCTPAVQLVMAKQLHDILGKEGLLCEPTKDLNEMSFSMPSPEAARGKVIILGKRSRSLSTGGRVMNDDYDRDNDVWNVVFSPSEVKSYDEEEDQSENNGVVVGFDARGPIRATDSFAVARSPTELLERALRDASGAQRDASEAKIAAVQLEEEATKKEQEAMILTQKAGIPMREIANRAARAGNRLTPSFNLENFSGEEKSAKDEGVEIHEVLQEYAEHGRDHYDRATREALDANNIVKQRLGELKAAEDILRKAQADYQQCRSREMKTEEEARRARSEAIAHREHAQAARVRLAKVQELVKANEETSTSAETVVVTALTEAKISEKRASDAEARAQRAMGTAEKDRARADEETAKEEELEQQVNEILEKCADATRATKAARERVEKAAGMLDRVNEQIKLIESSSQYRKEVSNGKTGSANSPTRYGGSFVSKHAAKVEERETCKVLIKEASEEHSAAEVERNRLQKDFEDYNHVWKIQAELSAKLRKVADRSAHIAEELAEHAEEEREAANLRHIAREKAEANVENRGSHKESLTTQLQEAERAASEAANVAEESWKRADRLVQGVGTSKDHAKYRRTMDEKQRVYDKARAAYESAVLEKENKECAVLEEKRRIDLSNEVNKAAVREVATEVSRAQVEDMFQQEAIVAYSQATMLREEAQQASKLSKEASQNAKEKAEVARRAREYKDKMDLVVEVPQSLAKLTLLHSLKHVHWEKSLALSNAHVHTIAYNVLQRMVESQPDLQLGSLRKFTQHHLCRIFPSWKDVQGRPFSNYDPVFAWSLGCQLVSMNLQSCDERLIVAEGMFRKNGSCGYVLKPRHLLGGASQEAHVRWTFQILCAYNLPRSPVASRKPWNALRPVVKVSLHTGFPIGTPFTFETNSFKKAGPNPVFAEDAVCEIDVKTPSTAIVVFTVWEQGENGTKDFIAGAAVPVSHLREGYRSVALFDSKHARSGPFAFSSLFLQASKRH